MLPRFDDQFDAVYASFVFTKTRPLAEAVANQWPGAIVGGTGWSVESSLEQLGITTTDQDYSVYPTWRQSLGFSSRGCRLRCPFCVVPRKEGPIRGEQTIGQLWRGGDASRELILLDNDFFGQPAWRERIDELRSGRFRVSFNQGINARSLDNETAAAIASVDYRCDQMRDRRIYTAWDSRKDERRLMRGLELLVDAGVKPRHIMVYMLIGYWPGETHEDRDHRRSQLRAFGARPYPMPYERTPELLAFQRWVIGAYDKTISWAEWTRARWNPRKLTRRSVQLPLLEKL
ncbi:hypothetical protein LCGC14_2011100 [marine sediment metagenome]|uniref:Uncharacterized protein n=1 Tax=marine sediment metagenome TaxID=412755 RepID=A0A0F9HXL4_9ZZZZ